MVAELDSHQWSARRPKLAGERVGPFVCVIRGTTRRGLSRSGTGRWPAANRDGEVAGGKQVPQLSLVV